MIWQHVSQAENDLPTHKLKTDFRKGEDQLMEWSIELPSNRK